MGLDNQQVDSNVIWWKYIKCKSMPKKPKSCPIHLEHHYNITPYTIKVLPHSPSHAFLQMLLQLLHYQIPVQNHQHGHWGPQQMSTHQRIFPSTEISEITLVKHRVTMKITESKTQQYIKSTLQLESKPGNSFEHNPKKEICNTFDRIDTNSKRK